MANPDSTIIDYAPGYGPNGPIVPTPDPPPDKPDLMRRRLMPPTWTQADEAARRAAIRNQRLSLSVVNQSQQPTQTFQFTPMQLAIGALVLFLLFKK